MTRSKWGALDTYFFRLHVSWIAGCMATLMVASFVFELTELLRKYAGEAQMGSFLLGYVAFLKLPELLYKLMPFMVLFGSLFCLRSLKMSHQILVAYGAGKSTLEILKPFLVSTGLICILSLMALHPLSVKCLTLARLYTNQESSWLLQPTDQGAWVLQQNEEGVLRMIRVGHYDPTRQHVSDVSIFECNPESEPPSVKRIEAQNASLQGKQWTCAEAYETVGTLQPTYHASAAREGMIDSKMLLQLAQDTETVVFWALPKTILRFQQAGLETHRFIIYAHVLLSRTLLIFGFVFLAALFMIRSHHRSKSYGVFIAAAVLAFVIYLMNDILYSMALAHRVGVWALWIPFLLCGLGIFFGMTYEKKHAEHI